MPTLRQWQMHQIQVAKGGKVSRDNGTVVAVFYRRKTSECDIHSTARLIWHHSTHKRAKL